VLLIAIEIGCFGQSRWAPDIECAKVCIHLTDIKQTMLRKSLNVSGSASHWLDRARLRLYGGGILLASLIYTLRCAWYTWKLYGQPNGMDFTTFWASSRLWLDGTPLLAYSFEAMARIGREISPTLPPPGPLFYPPTFFLLLRPLALLPCAMSYVFFALGTAAVFVVLLRRILPMRSALLPILAFSGVWVNIAEGQNGCLTASFTLGGFLLLQKRPVLAGICIGMLSIKPHLAILFPIALACAGMWTAFISAGVTAIALTGLSIAVFGMGAIPAFLHNIHIANTAMAIGALPWEQTASLFAALRAAHVPSMPAYVAQACQAVVATGVVIWTWRRSGDLAVRAVTLVAGTCMISPYIYNYDAICLGVPIALYVAKGLKQGWLSGEREILCLAWLYPGLGDLFGYVLHVEMGPLVFASLLFLAVRRTRFETPSGGLCN
jgi:hypothetical protein